MTKIRPLPDGALPKFEGKPVRQCTIAITKAGDGLSDALEVAPVALKQGEDVYYVLHGQVDKVAFSRFDTLGDELIRNHVVATVEIVPVTREDVDELLRIGVDRVRKAQEAKTGTQRMAGMDAADTQGRRKGGKDAAAGDGQGEGPEAAAG